PVQQDCGSLAAREMVPVKQGPALFLSRGTLGSDTVDHTGQIRVVRRSVSDNSEVKDLSRHPIGQKQTEERDNDHRRALFHQQWPNTFALEGQLKTTTSHRFSFT